MFIMQKWKNKAHQHKWQRECRRVTSLAKEEPVILWGEGRCLGRWCEAERSMTGPSSVAEGVSDKLLTEWPDVVREELLQLVPVEPDGWEKVLRAQELGSRSEKECKQDERRLISRQWLWGQARISRNRQTQGVGSAGRWRPLIFRKARLATLACFLKLHYKENWLLKNCH